MEHVSTLLGDGKAVAQISEPDLQSQLLLRNSWANESLLTLNFHFLTCRRVRINRQFYIVHIVLGAVPPGITQRIHSQRSEAVSKAQRKLLLLILIIAFFATIIFIFVSLIGKSNLFKF